jgi:hypothetical protein
MNNSFTISPPFKHISMARSTNILLRSVSGRIGDVVIKQYGKKTVVSVYPDMSKVKRSKKQQACSKKFKQAVAYAKSLLIDPKSLARLKKTYGKTSPYHAAIREYYALNK